jgi:Ca-activated chloride channel family protein
MCEGGPSYLSAAVLYESLVVDSYGRSTPTEFPLVAIYPKEGTFWSDHPVGVVQREWVTDAHRVAAKLYVDYLRAEPQQRAALKFGFRPGNTSVPLAGPIDPAHGVDPDQPKTTLDVPPADVVDGAIALWRANKKHANVVLVFDTSGSMRDDGKITAARDGAAELIRMLDDDDTLSLLPFSTDLNWAGQGMRMREARDRALRTVASLPADGDTALYQATAAARQYLVDHPDPDKISAVVVLTDGEDTRGGISLPQLVSQVQAGSEGQAVRIFTIAYGNGAKKDVLDQISTASRAKSFAGKPQTIRAVFKEIATFF